jgi:acetoin utilization deacetylase AcuC-like enzyme
MIPDIAAPSGKISGLVQDLFFLAHRSEEPHLENPERLAAVYALLQEWDGSGVTLIAPRPASLQELGLIHSEGYIEHVAATAKRPFTQLSADTYACADTFAVASLSAGAVLAAIDAVAGGRVRNAFVLARPPGHHAEAGRANGYCIFNNVALGAQYARRVLGLHKVLILDWDLHHGNGIQHIFEQDPSVLYVSTHQYPLYPGTGHILELGRGQGEGFTLNIPLKGGWGDGDFACLYSHLIEPLGAAFKPDLILVAAGFDIHRNDPLGKMKVTAAGFAALTRIVMRLAAAFCGQRLVLVLEGGYHPPSMTESVQAVIDEMCDRTCCDVHQMAAGGISRVSPVLRRCQQVFGPFWQGLPETCCP